MAQPIRALVFSGNGINCEDEMAQACKLAGAQVDIVHLNQFFYQGLELERYHLINFPGGFLDGDDLGSAKACAIRLEQMICKKSGLPLLELLVRFVNNGGLIIGVCNGFQLLVKLGLLPALDGNYGQKVCTLTVNDSGRFEDRWVNLIVNSQTKSPFVANLEQLYLPVRHGEGKFLTADSNTLKRLVSANQVVLRYADKDFQVTQKYPDNPNGSPDAIAAICDGSGQIFGLMPHPEAFLHPCNHPRWTREKVEEDSLGLVLFKNAVQYLKTNVV